MSSSAPIWMLALRPSARSLVPAKRAFAAGRRTFADSKDPALNQHNVLPQAPKGESGPNMQQAEHVSEEAAKMAKIQGGSGPDLEQGTPVQEILAEDKDLQKQAPQVMKDAIKKDGGAQQAANSKPSTGTRSFSTFARRRLETTPIGTAQPDFDPAVFSSRLATKDIDAPVGHKFPLPDLPLPPGSNKDKRYEPLVEQLTNLIMQHGKKATAQRNMAYILNYLRTAPPPTFDPRRPLLPGHPPASQLPLHPILYLQLAIDSVAPLLRIRSQRGAAGGGVALQIPIALHARQRRRIAFQWILQAVENKKRPGKGSGKFMFAHRVAEEIVAVIEGRSSVWEKRLTTHKLGTTARVNLLFGQRGGKRRRF